MFNNEEREQLRSVNLECVILIKEYRATHGTQLKETPTDELHKPFFELYRQFAGVEPEFDALEIITKHYLAHWVAYRHEAD